MTSFLCSLFYDHCKKSRKSLSVIPAKAGIHSFQVAKNACLIFKGIETFFSDNLYCRIPIFSAVPGNNPESWHLFGRIAAGSTRLPSVLQAGFAGMPLVSLKKA